MKRLLVVLRWLCQQSSLYWLACVFSWVAFIALVKQDNANAMIFTLMAGFTWWLDHRTQKDLFDD